MARLTISQLSAELASLRAYAARLEAELESAKADLAAAKAAAPVKPARPVYVAPAPTAEQLERRAAMAAARELAMRTGRSVKVGA